MSSIKVITSVQRRRRWSAEEKRAIVDEAEQPGMSISAVARKYDINPNQLFNWRRLMRQGALEAVKKGERVVPESEVRFLKAKVRELERMLGKKTGVTPRRHIRKLCPKFVNLLININISYSKQNGVKYYISRHSSDKKIVCRFHFTIIDQAFFCVIGLFQQIY